MKETYEQLLGGVDYGIVFSVLYVVLVQLYCGPFSPLWGFYFFIRPTEWRVTVMTSKLIKRHKINSARKREQNTGLLLRR